MTSPYPPPNPYAPSPPHPPPGQMRRRGKFWLVVAGVWFGTFGCTAALMSGGEDPGGASAEAAPRATVTATATETATEDPDPAPTVTETEEVEVEVEVTETVTEQPDAPAGGDNGDTADGGSVHYENCAAARAAGAAPVQRGDPGYGSHLDRDGDGTGCDWG